MSRTARWLTVAIALAGPAAGVAQTAQVGSKPGLSGAVVGRVCLDLDRDGTCRGDEPGIAGARLRLEDGRRLTADESGAFHVAELSGRIVLPDRSAYGAHVLSVDGLGTVGRFELAPGGVARVDLPVEPPAAPAQPSPSEPHAVGPPRVEGDRLVWTLGGAAGAGAWVRAGGREARASEDGGWSLALPLADGANSVGVAVGADGGAVLWVIDIHVARPASGALRVYPGRPQLLATVTLLPASDGALLVGRAEPGSALRIGGGEVRVAEDGRFAAWHGPVGPGVTSLPVEVERAGAKVEAALPVTPPGSSFDGVVLGELELQLGGDAGFLASGRLAGYMSGRWSGFTVDAGADLDDRDRSARRLASPRDASAHSLLLDPVRTFPESGDRGTVEDANAGRGRLWGRVDGHGLRLDVGTVRTAMTGPELGRYDRAYFGGRVAAEREIGGARVGATLFGGRVGADESGVVGGVPCQDRLAATGGSLYYLSGRSLAAGSERVRVEWRDPVSNLTVASRELTRGRDYDLDAVGGRLLLTRPLASSLPAEALMGGDPFSAAEGWLVVDYLRAAVGGERGLSGGELRGELGPVAVALSGASESRPGPDWQLARAAASLDLGAPLKAGVEVARSERRLFGEGGSGRAASLDGGFSFASPPVGGGETVSALHVHAEGALGKARWRGWWRERPAGYSDGSFDEPIAARERGALAEGALGPVALRLAWAEQRGADPRDPAGTRRRDVARAYGAGTLGVGPVDLTLEGFHERLEAPTRGAQSAAGLRAAWNAGRGLTLEVGHLQSFAPSGEVESRTFTSVGGAVRSGQGALAIRAGWGPDVGPRVLLSGQRGDDERGIYGTVGIDPSGESAPRGDGGAIGGRQRVAGGTLFTEERVARDPWGLVAGRVVGAALTPVEGLAIVLSGERGERWSGGVTSERGAGALSAAWERGSVRIDGRGELRSEGSEEQWLAGGGLSWAAARSLSLSARAVASDGQLRGRSAGGLESWLSAAWRSDLLSVLARLGRVKDERDGVLERDASLAAVAVTARVHRRGALGAGVEVARQRVSGAEDDRLAGSVRGELTLLGPIDVALEYARRGSLDGRALGDLWSLRSEAGVTAGGFRLALGYTLAGFVGTGNDPAEEDDGRFYVRAVLAR